jgi:Transposase, Mutator family
MEPTAMTVHPSIDPAPFLQEELAQASPDLLRELMGSFINTLLSAQADAVCGADYGSRDPERTNRRNGYRHRDLDTRVGTLGVAVPKLRSPRWRGCSACWTEMTDEVLVESDVFTSKPDGRLIWGCCATRTQARGIRARPGQELVAQVERTVQFGHCFVA